MTRMNRAGLLLVLLGIVFLMAAPHSESMRTLAGIACLCELFGGLLMMR